MTPDNSRLVIELIKKEREQARSEALEDAAKVAELNGEIQFSGWALTHRYGRKEVSIEIAKEIRSLKGEG